MAVQPFRITPVYDLLLRGSVAMPFGLHHLHMTTATQLCRLHYSLGSLNMVKARLKVLVDNGYAQADGIPTKLFRSPYYYCLSQKGAKYLEDIGVTQDTSYRAGREVNKHALFIEHTLELNDVVISALLLNPPYRLDNFMHERDMKRRPCKLRWNGKESTQVFTLIPDAFLDFRLALPNGKERRMPVLLEHDRGTEGRDHFKRRIRAYIVLLKTEAYKEVFGVKAVTIAFTTFIGPSRLKQMCDWTREELDASGEGQAIANTFLFTNLSVPIDSTDVWLKPCWHMVHSDSPISLLV